MMWLFLVLAILNLSNGSPISKNSSSSEYPELSILIDNLEKDAASCMDKTIACARSFITKYDHVLGELGATYGHLMFEYETNITDAGADELTKVDNFYNRLSQVTKPILKHFNQFSKKFPNDLQRMFYFATTGISNGDSKDLEEVSRISNELKAIFAKAVVFDDRTNRSLSLEPEITRIMKNSRDYDELTWAWKGWHDASGARMRHLYTRTVELYNKAARESGYEDLSECWIQELEDDQLEANMKSLLEKIMPLYQQLHTYVKRRLDNLYGSKYRKAHDARLIPAHILGEMNGQDWTNIYDLIVPYPEAKSVNLTLLLLQKNYTVTDMFKEAEKFFVSIGLFKMTDKFWQNSMLEKPTDERRAVDCHGSAFDLYTRDDFRIKMCSIVDATYFTVIHHEMGHVEYYMSYENQPSLFRSGANSGFHEAIGDTIALSVMSHKHLKNIGFISSDKLTHEEEINFLMKQALKKIAFLPFAYVMDKWRWNVFRGVINESNYNSEWWRLRRDYQGLEEPVERSENDFDPGAKYHIPNYTPYARYFISYILQFQLFKQLCSLAGQDQTRLHECDFYNSKTAGFHFKKMLELGASKHWKQVLRQFTGESSLNAEAILDYFRPLEEWLKMENIKFEKTN